MRNGFAFSIMLICLFVNLKFIFYRYIFIHNYFYSTYRRRPYAETYIEITKDIIESASKIGHDSRFVPNIRNGTNSGITIIAFRNMVLLAPRVKALTNVTIKTIPRDPKKRFRKIRKKLSKLT